MQKYKSIDLLRLILSFAVCVLTYGFPLDPTGGFVQFLCGAAPLCFFIISGFLTCGDDSEIEEKLRRAIGRSALLFCIMLICNVMINIRHYRLIGVSFPELVLQSAGIRRIWFQFLVFNYWPFAIGENIWFIQCLLYGYIAMYILHRLNLLRFDFIICPLCMIFGILTGELAGLLHFSFLGYAYIPSTVLTRALPYLLLGRILGWNRELLFAIPNKLYLLLVPVGGALAIWEMSFLSSRGVLLYTAHMAGLGLIALGLTAHAFTNERLEAAAGRRDSDFLPLSVRLQHFVYYGPSADFFDIIGSYPKYIYALHTYVGTIFMMLLSSVPAVYIRLIPWLVFIIYFTCLLIAACICGCVRFIGGFLREDAQPDE